MKSEKEEKDSLDAYGSGTRKLFTPSEKEIENIEAIARANRELRKSNRQIIEQQKSVIEEERLKVLLQMAGAISHELNQPLMALMGNIELLRLSGDDPEKWGEGLDKIEEAGNRIADIVKKIETIRRDQVKPYAGGDAIIDFDQSLNLLVVEDSEADFALLCRMFEKHSKIKVIRSGSMADGLQILRKNGIDVVLLDYLLPDGTGLDFLSRMEAEGLDAPVIALTGQGDEMVASRLIKAGAYDYLTKVDISQEKLVNSINKVMENFRLRQEVARATKQMAEMAIRDGLTRLYNRSRMNDVLKNEFNRAKRYKGDLSCLMIDLDHFKVVNDQFGHVFGDSVLKQFAKRLTESVRESDTCFRYGGEEFMVLLPQTGIEGAITLAEKIRQRCEKTPYNDGRSETTVTVSIGVTSIRSRTAEKPEDLLSQADKALYKAKTSGRNCTMEYSP